MARNEAPKITHKLTQDMEKYLVKTTR